MLEIINCDIFVTATFIFILCCRILGNQHLIML